MANKLSNQQAAESLSQTDDLSWLDEVASGDFDATNDDDIVENTFASSVGKSEDDALAWLNTDDLIDDLNIALQKI